MNNIWIATDWHLWNTEYDDGRHKFKSITRLGQLADEYTSVIGTNDLFIHLGDLCDPSNTKPEKLKAIIQSIPGTKILCRGNHDTEPDEYYLAAGFDHVCEILVIHDLVFSHKPVNVGVDQINIHGHLHTRKLSTLDSRYLNAYDVNYSDKPVLLEDLLQHAVQQTKADYADTEFKQDKVDKMFDSIENDHYENILNLSEEFDLEQQLIQENETYRQMLKDNSIDTGINIHDLMNESFFKRKSKQHARKYDDDDIEEVIKIYRVPKPTPVNKTYNSEKNLITDIESDCKSWINKMLSSSKFEDDFNEIKNDTDLIDEWNLQTHNKPLNKNNVKQELDIKCKYDKFENGVEGITVFDGYQELRITYSDFVLSLCKLLEFKYFDWITSVNYGDGDEGFAYFKINRDKFNLTEASIAPMLHSLSATEIEKDDRLDEVIYDSEDEEDTPFIDESYSIKKRKMGNNYFLVHQVDELFENGTETIGPEVVTMCEDFLDAAIQILPEDLNEETLAAIDSAEKLVDYLTELFYYDENDTSERYRKHSFVMQVVSAIARQMVRDKKKLTPITLTRELDDIIPQDLTEEQFNEFIQAGINKLKEIENAAANALVLNSVLLGVNENLNSIYAIKQEIKKNKDKIIIKSGFGPIEYNYKYPRYARGRVFFSRETYSEFVIRDKVLTPERLYARAVFYDFIIVSHEKYSDQFNYKIQQVMIDNNPYDDVMEIIKYLNKNYDNPKILLLACNSKSFDLDKYSNVTYADAPIMEAAIPAYNMNLTASDTMSEVSTIVKVHTKAANKTRKKIKKLVEASDYFGTTEKEYKELQKDNEFVSRFGKPTLKLIICNNAGKKNLVEKKTGISGIALSEIDWHMAPKAFVSILDIVDYYLYYFEVVAKYMHTKLNSLSENYGFNIDMPSSVTFTEYNIKPVQDMGFHSLQECEYFAKRYQIISENTDKVNITKDGKVIKSIDNMDEVVFEDPEDTIYWEQDDDTPKLYKEKEPMTEATTKNLYHLSEQNLNDKTLTPRIPDNFLVKNGYEDKETPRVCFTSSINKSLRAMSQNLKGKEFYVHIPSGDYETYKPSTKEVPDSKVTGEVWITEPVKLTCIGKIKVGESFGDGIPYQYGNNTAELYDWEYEWVEKYNLNEAAFTRYKDDYKPKNKKSINDLNCVKIDKAFTQKYKWVGESLKRNEIYLDRDVAYAWLTKNDKIVARLYITNEDYGDGYKWIALIEVENGYRGNGYGEQVLEFAITHEHGNALGVHKNNTVAINMYKKHGFKISPESQAAVDSGRTNYYQMYRGKGNKNINEAIGAAVMTGMTIASGVMSTTKAINDWYKKNDITEYVIFNASENKMYKCIDNTYKFEKTAEIAEKQVDKTFVFLRTSNNLDKKQTERYNTARKYWSKVKSEHKKATKNESIDLCEEITLTVEHLAELHKAHPELSTILPDDGKDIKDPTKYYCSKVWMQNENVIATASIRYPQANATHYSEIQNINISEGYESYTNSIMNRVNELYDSRITESVMISTTDPVDIYDYKYEVLEEATKGSDILYPVYVILTNSGHASISFNAELKTMYTFGMKQEDNAGFGFDVKSINDNHDDNTLYSVYCVFVNQAQLKKLKDRVQYFVKHETDFLFDYPGIELNDTNLSANSQHRWFCSRFVTDLLNIGSSNKKTQYITDDLSKTNFAHYICGGSIKNFKSSNIEAQTLRALEQEKNERILRDKKPLNIVQGLQEAASTLSPATRDDMNKLNAKWDLRPIGYGDRDKYIAEEEEKLKRMKEHDRKIKEMKDKNKQRIKAEKQAKKVRKLKVKNEEVHDPFNVLDQERFFDWNDYHNTVLGESVYGIAQKNGINRAKESIKIQIDNQDNYKNGGAGVIKNLEDTISHYEKVLDAMEKCEQHPDFKGPYSELPRPFNMMLDLNAVYKNNLTKRDVDNYINWCKQTALPESKRKYEKWKSVNEAAFKLELEDKNFQFLMDMNESATGNNKLVPVFVILTHSHSAVSKLVQATTGDEYTHASISFDSSLTHMYTFGRTSDSSVLKGSFKIEDISSAYYQNHTPPIPYSLFCIPVTEAQKNKMEKKVNYFAKNKNKFHFDFFGLFVNAMGIPNNPKNRYFCSRFVSVILNAGDPKNPLVSEPSLQRPYSFAGDDYVRFVCSGENIALYDQVVADRIIKDIMRTEKLVRAQKSRVKNENFLGINSSDPFASDVLHYKFAMLDESGMDNFMRYLSSFKIQFDKEGNVIISRKEYDQLDKHFRESVRLCRTYSEAGNVEGIKEELAKVHYMIQLINKYYLSPNANKNPRMKSDIKKDMLDLRSVMLNHFNTYMKWITIREPQFNFQAYYDTSKYGNTNMVPAKVLTAVGKVLVTAL